jgi:hypothetical protein
MKKIILFLLVFISSFTFCIAQEINENTKSISTLKFLTNSAKSLNKYDWISFSVDKVTLKDSKIWNERQYDIILHYDKKDPIIFVSHKDRYTDNMFCVSKDEIKIIDYATKELTIYSDSNKKYGMYSFYGTLDYVKKYFEGLGYYLIPMSTKIDGYQYTTPNVKYYKDTIINNLSYKKHTGFTPKFYTKAVSETDETYEYETYDRIDNYINDVTLLLDSIYQITYSTNPYDKSKNEITFKIYNYDFSNKEKYLDSIFNLNNPEYATFSKHNQDNIPLSRRLSKNKNINDSILDFPLVSLNNDTIYLRNKGGWTLLNLWTHNCSSCIKNLHNYKHEKDSLGYRILEKEGIEILAINYSTDNMDILENMADKTNSNDIIYSAKGLNAHLNIPYLGYYYLIPPDKKVVFKDYKLGDYSELLKAKEEYENKNK